MQEVYEISNMKKVFLDGQAIEVVQKFCYLGDMIEAQGGAGAGVIARVRNRWSKGTSAITDQQSITTVNQGKSLSDMST